ncbi:putative bacterial alpha-l-rhamnosidase domain protein [Diaporthe ampelina]|uniref:Putative bacterial alpha-l-rhamnosidase domain protein n=1 Tax=Diaporthe ampelina TaxID=1214573 RepID=A0A0G2G057_9PEZI|nr:putative bacterial alpha-l-rhamnosidase domain protein [Diaporthe ampelina]
MALTMLFGLLASTAFGQSCWRDTGCSTVSQAAFPGEWDANNFAPESRTVSPRSVLSAADGSIISSWNGTAHLATNGSRLVFDYSKEVGGIVSLRYTPSGPSSGAVGLAFTESKNWIGEWSDSSNGKFVGPDGAVYSNFTGAETVTYTMPDEKLRGGFRYLTLFLMAESASVDVSSIELEIGFQPTWSNLRAYQGYFHSSDDLLNKIWYSGAYTLQTNAVPVDTGRWVPFVNTSWANNGTLGPGDTIIVDGAKRDRAVWPGDMGIAVPSTFVSVGDLDSVRNALQVMYDYQNADGSFPEAGPPLLQQGSDTYHMWTMIGTYNYVLYTNDTAFLARNWGSYLAAMDYIYAKVQPSSGLLNVTGTRDWARWQTGFNMSSAQMILYRTLTTGADLAAWQEDSSSSSSNNNNNNNNTADLPALWASRAAALQNATLAHCFDATYGAFRDNATATALHPQDANSMAVLFGVVGAGTPAARSISSRLTDSWTPLGPEAPELPGNISPFISSFEVQAHLAAGETTRALDLVRTSWGWYLGNGAGTQSTVVEGYLVNGTFGYRWSRGYGNDFSYVSHAHGWSSGPTSALTEFVLGLSVTARVGSEWLFAPQFGGLGFAEGGFVTALGKFQARWDVAEEDGGDGAGYNASVSTPAGTVGRLVLPVVQQGSRPAVVVDGEEVQTEWFRKTGVVFDTVVVEGVEGGEHTIVVS